jgi:hypothetical protein
MQTDKTSVAARKSILIKASCTSLIAVRQLGF